MKNIIRILEGVVFVAVLGVCLPYFAYKQLCPWGARDYYESMQFQVYTYDPFKATHGIPLIDKKLYLHDNFGMTAVGAIEDISVAKQIFEAPAGSNILVTVTENWGGDDIFLNLITSSIQLSKAKVFLTVRRFGMSCGTFVLNSGNYLILPDDSLLLIHTGSVGIKDSAGKVQWITQRPNTGIPEVEEAYQYSVKRFASWLPYLSTADKARFLNGDDVFITGRQVCTKYGDSNAPVLFHYDGGCVLQGLKQ